MSKKILGIEFGSTRIKAVLIDEKATVLAIGTYDWESDFIGGHFTYPVKKVLEGLRSSYADMVKNYDKPITVLDGLGISAMMHGYLAFDKDWNLLEPFRSWRDTTTEEASEILTEKLNFHMPQRWSATHYYQAILNKEKSVKKVTHLQTLAGYVHYLLTGQNVLGCDDASGMFPLFGCDWDRKRAKIFDELCGCDIISLLPKVLKAGKSAGILTVEGARLLDESGALNAGAVCCPPEGDMGTGMVATNSVSAGTANVSSGTAANMTVILDKPLKKAYNEIDIIATPDGLPAALVHTNNCTTEINEWVNLFGEVITLFGGKTDKSQLYTKLFEKSAESDEEVGEITAYNYLAGEPLANTTAGAPVVIRGTSGKLNLANFMQAQIYSAISGLSLGMDILKKENVLVQRVTGHGGYYKTPKIGQIATSAVLGAPVTVNDNAGEGGAWGIAILAAYVLSNDKPLWKFLDELFANQKGVTVTASRQDVIKCKSFIDRYKQQLSVAQQASKLQE